MKEAAGGVVHVSGPCRFPQERSAANDISKALEEGGFLTYLPYRDGIDCCLSRAKECPGVGEVELRGVIMAGFALEMFQVLKRCDSLVFNMNGRVPDECGLFETAVAFTAGKPVVIYKNDNRSVFNGKDNSMISGLAAGSSTVGELEGICGRLAIAIRDSGRRVTGNVVPPGLRRVVSLGEEIWGLIGDLTYMEAGNTERVTLLNRLAGREIKMRD